uniref:Kertain 95 n=1 Tax=Cyprinus carpio TaxID=7962 RepID=A0A8C1M5L9_CYPCA
IPNIMASKSIVTLIRCGMTTPCAPKAYIVYGCGFGGSSHISSSCYLRVGYYPDLYCKLNSGGFRIMLGNCDYIQLNEKGTMLNLNDCLASCLRCRSVSTMRRKVTECLSMLYINKFFLISVLYYATINNANIPLQIDNSKLAADDLKIKYEHELVVRQSVEADIANLRCLLDQTTLTKADLEIQIETLQEDLACLKKNHQEEAALFCQLTNTKVCVEVDAAPQQDLNKVLDDIRCHYESIINKHRRKQECWFKEKVRLQCGHQPDTLETSRSQISEFSDWRSSCSLKSKGALECSLLETEARYSTMLAGYQKHINTYEAELCQVHTGIEQQGRHYAALLDIKTRLEQEIATYRCLLEKQDIKKATPTLSLQTGVTTQHCTWKPFRGVLSKLNSYRPTTELKTPLIIKLYDAGQTNTKV